MSENEIKPVAWTSKTQLSAVRNSGDGIMTVIPGRWKVALYDQSAIDRLTTQLDHYQMAATAEADLADERHKEIKRLTAERDEALAAVASKAGWEWKKRAEQAEADRDAAVADASSLRERMLALEAQRDEFGSREWQAEKSRRKAIAAVNIAYRHLDVESLRVSHCKDLAAIEAAMAEAK